MAMTNTQTDPIVATCDSKDIHPILSEALKLAAEVSGARSAVLTQPSNPDDVTSGAPLGVDGLCLLLPGARPRELGGHR